MVRVNDVHTLRARGSEVRVVHVDIGFPGIVRRLGWERPLDKILKPVGLRARGFAEDRAPLVAIRRPSAVGLAAPGPPLKVAQGQLAQLHPAELAEIMEELDRFERPAILEALDTPKAAQTLAELPPELQRLLLEALDVRRASVLLSTMAPDEAADVLEELPERLRERLMSALPAADAATVNDLLSYEIGVGLRFCYEPGGLHGCCRHDGRLGLGPAAASRARRARARVLGYGHG